MPSTLIHQIQPCFSMHVELTLAFTQACILIVDQCGRSSADRAALDSLYQGPT